jgi:hypothetical protein
MNRREIIVVIPKNKKSAGRHHKLPTSYSQGKKNAAIASGIPGEAGAA